MWNTVSLPYGFTLFSNCAGTNISDMAVSLPYGFTLFSNYHSPYTHHRLVSLPYGFTLFSNKGNGPKDKQTVSLPYGFTLFSNAEEFCLQHHWFHYLMDLHYSQTGRHRSRRGQAFHYLMDLHYSQTVNTRVLFMISFTTLWIYTILKRQRQRAFGLQVSLPYGFTLFSNNGFPFFVKLNVSLPYGFTLFSNFRYLLRVTQLVSLPYGFTLFSNRAKASDSPSPFHYLMDLHYSQTKPVRHFEVVCFTTLWIYTILKLNLDGIALLLGFTTLWIYTILKHVSGAQCVDLGFTTLWIYTILKRVVLLFNVL